MKLLVFAHTPPPHHGQSLMVELLLNGFGGDKRIQQGRTQSQIDDASTPSRTPLPKPGTIECYHVNTRFSADIADMGQPRFAKFFLVFRFCFEAILCRFRFRISSFYFAPAPPKKPAFYRDLLVMILCRPFFRHFVHHWHGVGLGDWLEESCSRPERWLAHRLLGKPSLGIALSAANLRDPLWFRSREVAIVPNGIPDPFPDFDQSLRANRLRRLAARRHFIANESRPPHLEDDTRVFRILYLAHCFREKGIFETLQGVAEAAHALESSAHPLTLELTVAGDFASETDRREFDETVAKENLGARVRYVGFVTGTAKSDLLRNSDCLCFPTYSDSFGLVVLEAMAAGLAVIATAWRALPEILPPDYPGLVPIRDGRAIGQIIPRLFTFDATILRERFLSHFTIDAHLRQLREALLSVDLDRA